MKLFSVFQVFFFPRFSLAHAVLLSDIGISINLNHSIYIRVVKLLLIVIVIVIAMTDLWTKSNRNSNRLLKIPE